MEKKTQAHGTQLFLAGADDLESGSETDQKTLFFEFAEKDLVEEKMEDFITKNELLNDWTYTFFAADGSKVQEDPMENENLWPLKAVFSKKAPKKPRPYKFFHPSRYENLSPEEKLHAAACDDNCNLIEQLAKEGVDLNATRQDGQTALDACAWSGSQYGVETLLDCGADPAATVQALAGAASWGHADLLKRMLHKGGKVNQEHGNYTSLQWAIRMNHEDCALVLQKFDAIALEANKVRVLKSARGAGMCEFLQKVAETHPELAQDCEIRATDKCSIM